MSDYVDEVHERISMFADDFLEEDERPDFVDGMLERLGYERQSSWGPPQAAPGGQRQPVLKPRQQRGGRQGGGQGGGGGQQQQQPRSGSYFRPRG